MESRKIFTRIFTHIGKNEEIFTTSRKYLSRNIYFGTEFKKSRKFLPRKFGAIRYDSINSNKQSHNMSVYTYMCILCSTVT